MANWYNDSSFLNQNPNLEQWALIALFEIDWDKYDIDIIKLEQEFDIKNELKIIENML